MTTIIRVKRKREADPEDALLVACKKVKAENILKRKREADPEDDIGIERKIFRYATTIDSNAPLDQSVTKKVQDAILLRNKIKKLYKTPSVLSQKIYSYKAPPTKKYNVVHGPVNNLGGGRRATVSLAANSSLSSQQRSDPMTSEKCSQSSNDLFALLDVEQELLQHEAAPKSQDIVCDYDKMMREMRHVSITKQDEYVYDVFFCQKTTEPWNMLDVLYVKPYSDLDFVSHEPEASSYVENDDDDSNDEDNWRNDYPDEENHSFDENERSFLFEEKEYLKYDSDDCDVATRAYDEDYYNSCFHDLGSNDDCALGELEYGDDLGNGFDSI